MTIPKYITHPLLLIAAGVLVGSLLWLKMPSQKSLEEAKEQMQKANQTPAIDFNELAKISAFNPQGCLVIGQDTAQLICITDPKLHDLSGEELFKVQKFFRDKWIRKSLLNQSQIDLPLELWDGLCLTAPQSPEASNLCPLLLKP